MIKQNYRNKRCVNSFLKDGSCCCNCINRYLLFVGGMPMKFVCRIKEGDTIVITDIRNGHGMCEMHQFENEQIAEKLNVE